MIFPSFDVFYMYIGNSYEFHIYFTWYSHVRFIAGFPICIQYEFSIKKTYVFGYDNNIFFSHFFPISNFSIAKVKFYVVYTENNKKFIKTFFLKLKQAN